MGLRVVDPRTGQILHGHARIGSLRLRQDALIVEAMLGLSVNASTTTILDATTDTMATASTATARNVAAAKTTTATATTVPVPITTKVSTTAINFLPNTNGDDIGNDDGNGLNQPSILAALLYRCKQVTPLASVH